ncbi:MAG: T9SS C-terminal target domain-containing protein [Calditrichaeota bacterium]|nr:MAG: T9SS C-terminal target domain-containing protein [Calditrichota bacterium]
MKQFLTPLLLLFASSCFAQTVSTLTASFNASGGVAYRDGFVYVADFGTALNQADGTNVYKVDPTDGSFSVFATGLSGASGNSFDSQGNLFQSNIAASSISKIDTNGIVTNFSSIGVQGPVGIAIDSLDNVFVANCGNSTIRKISAAGVSTPFASNSTGLLSCPNGLTIDENGNLYTCNFGNGNIVKIDPNGVVTLLTVMPGGNNGHLTYANGFLFVVDRGGNSVWMVSLEGEQVLVAGSGFCGKLDGVGNQATFSFPNGIRATPSGDTLFVNDAVPLCNSNLNPIVVRMITGINSAVGIKEESYKPISFSLSQNYPNPFNPSTSINYELGITNYELGRLSIFNTLGETVKEFEIANSKGSVIWDGTNEIGKNVSSGVYFYELKIGNQSQKRKMVLMK